MERRRAFERGTKSMITTTTRRSSTAFYFLSAFFYISKDLALRIEASSIVRSDKWSYRLARISTEDMIGRHCDGWIELIGVIRRDHCNVLQSKLRLLRRPSVEQGWSTGSAGVRDSSARSGVHDCTYPPHRSTCDQCRYFPSCTRGPP